MYQPAINLGARGYFHQVVMDVALNMRLGSQLEMLAAMHAAGHIAIQNGVRHAYVAFNRTLLTEGQHGVVIIVRVDLPFDYGVNMQGRRQNRYRRPLSFAARSKCQFFWFSFCCFYPTSDASRVLFAGQSNTLLNSDFFLSSTISLTKILCGLKFSGKAKLFSKRLKFPNLKR